jgi:glyoxylase-like metal-dependent hydrolase (beta-lactamase superfamily II)
MVNGERPVEIFPVHLGMVTAYIVKQEGVILVDAGYPKSEAAILAEARRRGIDRSDIRLILLTHGHADHAGSALQLHEATGAPIALHEGDRAMARSGRQGRLKPTGMRGHLLGILVGSERFSSFPSFQPDIMMPGEFSLADYGVDGTVLPTPGHTAGSVSIVLGSGDALVGDLVCPSLPSGRPGLSFWADDPAQARESIKKLMERRPRRVYCGHGGPFSGEEIGKTLE